MSTTLNNFIKYSFTIRTLIQILYDFRTRKTLNLLRIKNLDSIISKTRIITKAKTVIIIMFFIIIKNATAVKETSLINRRKISFLKVVILVKSSIFVKKTTFFIKETPSFKIIILIRSSTFIFFVKETSFNKTSCIVFINEYRSSYIDIKNVIVFAFLKMKKVNNARHQFIFFKIKNLINLRLCKNYRVFIITSKKIRSQIIKSFKIF